MGQVLGHPMVPRVGYMDGPCRHQLVREKNRNITGWGKGHWVRSQEQGLLPAVTLVVSRGDLRGFSGPPFSLLAKGA